jgi:hypothetical protein
VNHSTTTSADPKRNPSYPARTHTSERALWQTLLSNWTKKVAAVTSQLGTLGDHPQKAEYAYLAAQLQGGLDQIADAARRLPGEVGHMYEEDEQRVQYAVAALDRVIKKWEALG